MATMSATASVIKYPSSAKLTTSSLDSASTASSIYNSTTANVSTTTVKNRTRTVAYAAKQVLTSTAAPSVSSVTPTVSESKAVDVANVQLATLSPLKAVAESSLLTAQQPTSRPTPVSDAKTVSNSTTTLSASLRLSLK